MKMLTEENSVTDTNDDMGPQVYGSQSDIEAPENKKNVYERLYKTLFESNILPQKNEDPIKGTELTKKLRTIVRGAHSDETVKSYLSQMSRDENSPIAKAARGHGYYSRFSVDEITEILDASQAPIDQKSEEEISKRDAQREEKFRALMIIYLNSINEFPAPVEHTKALRDVKGTNVWKYPDVFSLEWDGGILYPIGNKFYLDKNMLEMKLGSGESVFRTKSFELKVEINWSNYRKYFFQCLSNSHWANMINLGVAVEISDQNLLNKLKKLGTEYHTSIICFNMFEKELDDLPPADIIRNLGRDGKDALLDKYCCNITYIHEHRGVKSVDWDEFRDLCKYSTEFETFKKWIARCKNDRQAYSLSDFKIKEQEEHELSISYALQPYHR